DDWGMVFQPRVGGGNGGDPLLGLPHHALDRLAGQEAEPALGDERIRDGRCPFPGADDADADRELVLQVVVKRVAERFVALLLSGYGVLPDRNELLEGADAIDARAAVGGLAVDGDSEHQRATVSDDELEVGRLGDDDRVGLVPSQDGRERAKSAVLLTG